ncbi:DNA-binding transcriptional regulator, MerR family [Nakamurella panacisegetis]|uniref:DNA-binding transcriptional regulator, MerR family n=1 Tax=Nakamurella panacisegetis TaxID=1090615 RepID=A0A1H0S591_9ACTN|nr:MerR family transcriptional regulator [Nakamurella panacisegetis]SDP36775.1 DNA-binding transcriptional regulator, MerR family [Nakamurella panacisegetis]
MQTRLTIGQFSSMTHLSVKTLRRYHDGGLLAPAEVDEWTGYRYYDPDQIATAQTIRRLRDLDMPLGEIADLVGTADERHRQDLLAGHLRRLEERLSQTQNSVAALRRLLAPQPAELRVDRRLVPATPVLAISAVLDQADLLVWYARAMAELDQLLAAAGRVAEGPPGSLVDNAIFTDEHGELTVFLPIGDPPTAGRARAMTLPATDLAVTIHHGDHDDIDVTYGRLAHWALDHDLQPSGQVRETYLVGPRDTPRPEEWRTEIGWPVAAFEGE